MTKSISTKIFLDSVNSAETSKADEILKNAGFSGVEGQTTNPSLIAKRLENFQFSNSNFQNNKILNPINFYKTTIQDIAKYVSGPISIQVICDHNTSVDELLSQARERIAWIPNGVIKFPCIENGFKAAQIFCKEGPVNMTLVFTQEQAAAVDSATKQAKFPVYISPFVGRLDDIGINGMDITKNILKMFSVVNSRIQIITASVRTLDHLLYAIKLQSHIISIPFKVLQEWSDKNFVVSDENYKYNYSELKPIEYQDIKLGKNWADYDIYHGLTDSGVAKFQSDWENINKTI